MSTSYFSFLPLFRALVLCDLLSMIIVPVQVVQRDIRPSCGSLWPDPRCSLNCANSCWKYVHAAIAFTTFGGFLFLFTRIALLVHPLFGTKLLLPLSLSYMSLTLYQHGYSIHVTSLVSICLMTSCHIWYTLAAHMCIRPLHLPFSEVPKASPFAIRN